MGTLAGARGMLDEGKIDDADRELRQARSLIDRFEEEEDRASDPGGETARGVLQRAERRVERAREQVNHRLTSPHGIH